MPTKCLKYLLYVIVLTDIIFLLAGCGVDSKDVGITSSGNNSYIGSGYSVTGKISLANSEPIVGATVNIYKTSYKIYSTSIHGKVFYGTKDSSGTESIKISSSRISKQTNNQGIYTFSGMSSGNYTIQPTKSEYDFTWLKVQPAKNEYGIITITKSGMVYIYNPNNVTSADNQVSGDGTIIYNIDEPCAVTYNTLTAQDFLATLPPKGSIGIQF